MSGFGRSNEYTETNKMNGVVPLDNEAGIRKWGADYGRDFFSQPWVTNHSVVWRRPDSLVYLNE